MVAILSASACESQSSCGDSEAVVEKVIDGDTIELANGDRVRYLLVNTPEITGGKQECFGENAARFNRDLVLGQQVQLSYDKECEDIYDRTLAYVSVRGRDVNRLLVERGYACVLHIPPNGVDRKTEYVALERAAKQADLGLWGACEPSEIKCD